MCSLYRHLSQSKYLIHPGCIDAILQPNEITITSVSMVRITILAGAVMDYVWKSILESASSCVEYISLTSDFTTSPLHTLIE